MKIRKSSCPLLVLTAGIIGTLALPNSLPAIDVQKRVLSKAPVTRLEYLPPGSSMGDVAVSPDGSHVATVEIRGSRFVVVHDGVDGPVFEQIGDFEGPGGKRGAAMILSPDGRRIAYLGQRAGKVYLVVDGKEIEIQQKDPKRAGTLLFSADSSHYAMAAKGQQDSSFATWVIVDGSVGPAYGEVPELKFSPDGKRYAYIGRNGRPGYANMTKPSAIVVTDGKEGAGYLDARDLTFSPDGSRLAYAARSEKGWQLVLDGVAQQPVFSQDVRWIQFSRDGKHVAYVGADENAERAVVDGKQGKAYNVMREMKLSQDGSRHALIAIPPQSSTSLTLVASIDGKETLTYQGLSDILFSPDSQYVTMQASTPAGTFVLVNGEEAAGAQPMRGGAVVRVGDAGPALAYRLWADDNYGRVYWKGQEGPPLAAINLDESSFSPDGTRFVYLAGDANRKKMIYRDGAPFYAFPYTLGFFGTHTNKFDSIQWSPDSSHFALIGNKDNTRERYVFLDDKQGPSCFTTSMPTFSADGTQFAFACRAAGTDPWIIYVNGKPGPAVEGVLEDMPDSWRFTADGKLSALVIADKQLQHFTITAAEASLASYGAPVAATPASTPAISNSAPASPSAPATPAAANPKATPAETLQDKLRKKLPGIFK